MTKAATVQVGLLEKAEEVAPKLDAEMGRRVALLLDLVMDCQNRGIECRPVLVLQGLTMGQILELVELTARYRYEGHEIKTQALDDTMTLKF